MRKVALTIISVVPIIFISCSKDNVQPAPNAAVNVINAIVDVPAIKVNPGAPSIVYATTTDQVNYGAGKFYFAKAGVNSFTAVPSADTVTLLLNQKLDLKPTVYTMILAGQLPNIDTIFREEISYPFLRTDVLVPDSVVNIRFAHLSPNSLPVSIRIVGGATNEVSALAYKDITNFKAYPARSTNPNYRFEIRDAATDDVLLTYTFTITGTNRFKNVAIVLRGLAGGGGASALGVSAINYF